MSNHEAFNYLEHVAGELRRMLDLQTKLDPSSMEYAQLMRNMEVLAGSLEMYNDIADFFAMADAGIIRIEIIPGGVAEIEDDTPGCVDEPYVEEPKQFAEGKTDESEPAQVSSEPEKTYDMAEVRAALVAARRRGVNVTELLKEYGVDNFGAFPAGKYGELMERLGETDE